jgi:hypothetical protein
MGHTFSMIFCPYKERSSLSGAVTSKALLEKMANMEQKQLQTNSLSHNTPPCLARYLQESSGFQDRLGESAPSTQHREVPSPGSSFS